MPSKRVFLYRLYLVLNIAIIWVLFGLIFLYNIVEVDKELAKRRLSFFALGFAIIGFIVGGAEAFFSRRIRSPERRGHRYRREVAHSIHQSPCPADAGMAARSRIYWRERPGVDGRRSAAARSV